MQDTFNSAQQALNQLHRDFAQWRQQKKSSQEKIPLLLLEQANALTQHFDDMEIRQTLGITARQLERIKGLNGATEPPKFVELPKMDEDTSTLAVTISTPNGLTINISGFGDQPLSKVIDRIAGDYVC